MRMRPDGLQVKLLPPTSDRRNWFFLGVCPGGSDIPAWSPTLDEWAACVDAFFPTGYRNKDFIKEMRPGMGLSWAQHQKQTEDSVFDTACGLIAPREIDGMGRPALTSESALVARVLELETRLRVLEDKMNKRGSG